MKTFKQFREELDKKCSQTSSPQQKPNGNIKALRSIVEDRDANRISYQAYTAIEMLGSRVAFTEDVAEKLDLIAEQSTKLAYLMLLVIGVVNSLENQAWQS